MDTYVPFDIALLTGGAYTAESVAENPLCFATQMMKAQQTGLAGLSLGILTPLFDVISSISSKYSCVPISAINTSEMAACPGFFLFGGPTASVAPGAIQS